MPPIPKNTVKLTISIFAVLLFALIGFHYVEQRIAMDTYEAALGADNVGHEAKATKLFAEACKDGAKLACQALHGQ